MAEVVATLQLETSDALSTIDFIGTSLDSVVTNFSETFGNAISGIQTDFGSTTDDIATDLSSSLSDAITNTEPEIAALADIPITPTVTADVGEAEGEIANLSGETVEVAVTADTSEADGAIADLGSTADSTSGSLDGLTTASKGFSAAAGLAAGDTGALAGAASSLGPEAGAAVGGITALGGVLDLLFNKAVDAQGSIQRFHLILGDNAPAVESIKVGDLNTTLDKLAQNLGSTTPAFENAIASVYQHAQAAGFATDKSAQYADMLAALGARAVAANPRLGDLADVTESLETKFARAGRALVPYNIALSAQQVTDEALAQSGKAKAADLTLQERAYAGLTLATAQYGDTLSQKIDEGSKNPIIQQNKLKATFDETLASLGKPLIAPMFDLIKKVIPIAAEFASVFAGIGKEIIPALIPVLQASLPPLQIFGELLQELEPIIRPLTTAFLLLAAPITAVTFVVQHWTEIMNAIRPVLTEVGTAIAGFFTGIFNGAKSMVEDVISFFQDLPQNLLTALGDLPGLLLNAGRLTMTGLFNGAKAVLSEQADFFVGLPDTIINLLGDVGSKFVQIGVDITNGIISGVGNLADDLFTALTGGIDFTITKVKGKYQISSPSQVFADQIGLPIATGVAAGITGGGDAISAALISVVSPTAPLSQAVTTQAVSGIPSSAGVGGSGGPSQTNNFYGYSPQETAAVNGREWTRLTRFSGGG